MKVEIWSDVVCPWCYIGKRRFEAALQSFEHAGDVEVEWRSFELNPHASSVEESSLEERLSRKYGMTLEQARSANARVTAAAAAEGLDFRLDIARAGNTLDAHRLIHAAAEVGRQGEVKERLMQAYFTEGRPIGSADTLTELAEEAGLDRDRAVAALASDELAAAVRADEREAAALGINGVPFFVVDRRYGVSGAQPSELLLEVLQRAWDESHQAPVLTPAGGDAEACADDVCAV